MRTSHFTFYLILYMPGAQAQQSSTVIAPPTAKLSGCDLSVPGIDKKKIMLFFSKLKAAASSKDSDAMSFLVLYPLKINSSKLRIQINNPAEFKKNFSTVFNFKILNIVSKQELKDLFYRDQGAMIGNGEIWIEQKKIRLGFPKSTSNPLIFGSGIKHLSKER